MSYVVALQSAVFWFVACTPCMNVRNFQKARAKAKRERQEKARFEAEHPGLYRHPSPFSESPHWAEEIDMGPNLPKKAYRNQSQRRVTTGGSASSCKETLVAGSSPVFSTPTRSSSTIAVGSTITTGPPLTMPMTARPAPGSASILARDDESVAGSGSGSSSWNFKRYQREDEELWGFNSLHSEHLARTGHKLMDVIAKAQSSAGRLVDSALGKDVAVTNEDRRNFYSPARTPSVSEYHRNPPVNDYHPPVVSIQSAHRDYSRWMLQPPPPVKFMEAKVPVSRSASMSSTSQRSHGGPEPSLSKVVGERLLSAKMVFGADGTVRKEGLSAAPLTRRATISSPRSKQGPRSRSLGPDSDHEAAQPSIWTRRRAATASRATAPTLPLADLEGRELDSRSNRPAVASTDEKGEGQEEKRLEPSTQDKESAKTRHHHATHAQHAARRPVLSTITSESSAASASEIAPAQSMQTVLVGVDPHASPKSENSPPPLEPMSPEALDQHVTDTKTAMSIVTTERGPASSRSVNNSVMVTA